MADKEFNIFDECAARGVYQSPQEEEWTPFFLRGQNVHKSQGSKIVEGANWNKWKWYYIVKVRVFVESNFFKHL